MFRNERLVWAAAYAQEMGRMSANRDAGLLNCSVNAAIFAAECVKSLRIAHTSMVEDQAAAEMLAEMLGIPE